MSVLEKTFKVLGNVKVRKMKLNSGLLKIAACFVDYESEHLPPDSRIIEDSYVFSKLLGMKPCKVLDVGCVARHNYISPALAMNGWDVYGMDIRSEWQFHHPNFTFVQADVTKSGLVDEWFDAITCISTMEHIGLVGYYGNSVEDKEGDAKAMAEMWRLLRVGGTLLLTVPYCGHYFDRQGTRVYDLIRLQRVTAGKFSMKDMLIYLQDKKGNWNVATKDIKTEGVICLELVKI